MQNITQLSVPLHCHHHTGCSIQAVHTVYSTAEDQPFTTATEGW